MWSWTSLPNLSKPQCTVGQIQIIILISQNLLVQELKKEHKSSRIGPDTW